MQSVDNKNFTMKVGTFVLCTVTLFAAATAFSKDAEISEALKNPKTWKALVSSITSVNQEEIPSPNLKSAGFQSRKTEGEFCSVCRTLVGTLITIRRLGGSKGLIATVAIELCEVSDLAPAHVCEGMVNLNIDILLHIIDARLLLTPYTICGVIFQSDSCDLGSIGNNYFEWSISIDEEGRRPNNGSKIDTPKVAADDLIIVQITDTHYDPHYREGANAVCGEPACCREKQGNATLPENSAGRWGDYRDCDTPWEAVLDVFERVRANHEKIDYIYYTGDVIDHGVWETSVAENSRSIIKTFEALRTVFEDIPIYPIIGNHEPHPSNQFAPAQVNQTGWTTNELYDLLANTWDWLPERARDTIKQAGYYTVLLREGLRVIALNNNEGYTFNWWLLYDSRYSAMQLQWLHDTLLDAERNGEKVHILAHVPNVAGDMFTTYSREYRRIVDRFWDTISAQFNGHTHNDQFTMFYAIDEPSSAINVAWNGGSATAYSDVNPNYRIYSVDNITFQVTDHETWIYNLTEANRNREEDPFWFREYTFSEAYDIDDLSPATLDDMLTSFATNHDLLKLYWQHKYKMGDPSLANGCNNQCLVNHLCDITRQLSSPGAEDQRCEELTELFWSNLH